MSIYFQNNENKHKKTKRHDKRRKIISSYRSSDINIWLEDFLIMTTKQPQTDWKVICMGIGCITAMEIIALLKGINGLLLTSVIGIIAVAIGVSIKNPFIK